MVAPTIPANETAVSLYARLARSHPISGYFLLAITGSWIFWLPLALSRSPYGLGVIPVEIPDPVLFLGLLLGSWAGPALSSLTMTVLISGRPAVRLMLRRVVQWRVGPGWYAFVFLALPAASLLGYSLVYGSNLLGALVAQPLVILAGFVAPVAFSLPTANIQEEIGWRGFALPRLQERFGPFLGTAILGLLHSLLHLPVFLRRSLGQRARRISPDSLSWGSP